MPKLPSREAQREEPTKGALPSLGGVGVVGNLWVPQGVPKIHEITSGLSDQEIADFFASMELEEQMKVRYDWHLWARPNQLMPPNPWHAWWLISGRGFGKTRTGAESIREWHKQGYNRFVLVAPTAADGRDVMVEGESGILSVYPLGDPLMPLYEPSKRRITWPRRSAPGIDRGGKGSKHISVGTQAVATLFSDERPDRLRGPQSEKAWVDEPGTYEHLRDTWDNLQMGLRLGDNPQVIATTTPKPKFVLKDILAEPGTIITRGSTYENAANLADAFLRHILNKYEGTRTGLQELHAVLLEEAEGALWTRDMIENYRPQTLPLMERLLVAMDPADGREDGDEQALAVCGRGSDGRYYVIHSEGVRITPYQWAIRAIKLWQYYQADRIVFEANRGGPWVLEVLRRAAEDLGIDAPFKEVNATRSKRTRAEPVAALYEQGKVSHVRRFVELEDQMCNFTGSQGEKSPDRMDALVWGLTDLSQQTMVGFNPADHHNKELVTSVSAMGIVERAIMGDIMEVGF